MRTSMLLPVAALLLTGATARAAAPEYDYGYDDDFFPVTVTLGIEGQGFRDDDGGMALRMGFEGHRWGVDTRYAALTLDEAGFGPRGSVTQLLDFHLTYAPYVARRARFRLEAGANGFLSYDVSMLGLGLGASLEACVAGPLDFEARLLITPFPFHQVDAQGGFALRLGGLALRTGLRALYLDDAGEAVGVSRAGSWVGPYAGASFIF